MGSVIASEAAIDAIMRLRAKHGMLVFHQSGGCCAGSAPMCVKEAELPAGPDDVQIGEIGGVPFLIDRELYERWGHPEFRIDVVPGIEDSFSLETSEGIRFTTEAPQTANWETNP